MSTASKTTATKKAAARSKPKPRPVEDVDAPPLADQMAAESTPKAKPKGSPGLYPFQQLPRRQRGEILHALAKVQSSTAEVPDDIVDSLDQGADSSVEDAAKMYDLMADLEDALRVAAIDKDAYDEWVVAASDADFMGLAGWYMERFQVGEATASST